MSAGMGTMNRPMRRGRSVLTFVFLESLHGFMTAHWDHEPAGSWRDSTSSKSRVGAEERGTRVSVLDCGSPLPLSNARGHLKAPEDWRSPKPGGSQQPFMESREARANVIDCGSPLPLSDAPLPIENAGGLAESKTARPFVRLGHAPCR
jgi:hypothetical protein